MSLRDIDYTYKSYLTHWAEMFGEATTGEYGYWRGYKHYSWWVNRLSADEFRKHWAALQQAHEDFQVAYQAKDEDAMDQALADSFPHEMVLLV